MKRWTKYALGLAALAGLTPGLWAQPAGPAPAAPAVPAPPGPPQPALLNAIGLGPDQLAACKDKICSCCLGQGLLGFTNILSALSGGCLEPCCPPKPFPPGAGGAAGDAGKIQAELAKCKDEIKAIRYLATLDCHYFPEAGKDIADALRQSRCECVRLEAARALGTGCCCNPYTVQKLAICVAGSNRDGNPSETSERVRAAAYFSLEHCLACLGGPREPPKAPERGPETGPERAPAPEPKPPEVTKEKVSAQLAAYARQTNDENLSKALSEARLVIDQSNFSQGAPTSHASRGVFDILKRSMQTHTSTEGFPAGPITSEGTVIEGSPRPRGLLSIARNAFGSRRVPDGVVESEGVPVQPGTPVQESVVATPAPMQMPVGTPAPMVTPASPPASLATYPRTEVGSGAPGAPTSYTIYPMTPPGQASVPAPRRVEPVPEIYTAPATKVQPTTVVPQVELTPAPKSTSLPTIVTPKVESHPASEVGPQSRAPVAEPVHPVIHYEPAPAVVQTGLPMQYTQEQLVIILKNSSYPWQREWAVENLSGADARSSPEVVQLVLTTAQRDAAAPVRASAVRCLVQMHVRTVEFVKVLQTLRADSDPRVRHEAEQALTGLARPAMPVVSQPQVGIAPAGN
jgi:hypothetical protein